MFCDFENARGGCDRNGITGECRRAGEAALIRAGMETVSFKAAQFGVN